MKFFETISTLNYFLLVAKQEARPGLLLPVAFLIRVTVRAKRGPRCVLDIHCSVSKQEVTKLTVINIS